MQKLMTKVVHSKTKDAWNVVGTDIGKKYKIARVPYVLSEDEILSVMNKVEALKHAEFISSCFNNMVDINKFLLERRLIINE